MQVKKFEAKTMKDALAMVKRELGPEAIILSAKDNGQSFGLAGGTSVEVTAAISEKLLKKKKLAEKKMREEDLEVFRESPAPVQKKFIDKVYNRAVTAQAVANKSITARRYIDIDDEESAQRRSAPAAPSQAQVRTAMQAQPRAQRPAPTVALDNGRAVQARQQVQPQRQQMQAVAQSSGQPAMQPAAATVQSAKEVAELKSEISRLNQIISEFKSMPQTFISVHPGAERGVPYEFSAIYEKLASIGVDQDIILKMLEEAKMKLSVEEQKKKAVVDAWMARQILDTTRVVQDPYEGQIHTFIGASGQGKTSSLVKLAGQMVVNQGKRVALISADTQKVGASDQLKIFAQILNVPFATVRGPQDWVHIMNELGGFDHLLLDFPAVQFMNIPDIDYARRLLPPEDVSQRTHLVVAATSRNQNVDEMARGLQILNFDDVIFTKLDESVNHGLVYNFQRKFSTPIHSFGIGPKIPEDFEVATKERVLDLLFRLTKINNAERGNS